MQKDPACGMDVDEANAKPKATYAGVSYYFCSKECQAAFERLTKGLFEGHNRVDVACPDYGTSKKVARLEMRQMGGLAGKDASYRSPRIARSSGPVGRIPALVRSL